MANRSNQVRVVRGTEQDIPVILSLIKGLAEYEKLSAEVTATEEGLRESLFGTGRAADVLRSWCSTTCASAAGSSASRCRGTRRVP